MPTKAKQMKKRLVYIKRGNFRGMTGEIISQGTKWRAGEIWCFAEIELDDVRKKYYYRLRPSFIRIQ